MFEPVKLSGTTISRSTLHNEDELRRKDIRINDFVLIERSGDVIPKVVSVMKEKRTGKEIPFDFPKKCPVCHTATFRPEHEAISRCINPSCPARLTESSIVKKLESDGIGRPSTYASIIETLKKREYVELSGKSFIPTSLGYEVKEELETNFPHIMNVKFTAEMENKLDLVEEGEADWKRVLGDFYGDLSKYLEVFQKKVEEIENRRVESDVPCPCGSGIMVMKSGRFGRYCRGRR